MNSLRRHPLRWGWGLICIVIFTWMAIWQSAGVTPLDNAMADLAGAVQTPVITPIFKGITFLGESYTFVAVGVAVLLLSRFHRWGLFFSFGALGAGLLNQLLKFLVARPRPALEFLTKASGYSFPSGHSMSGVAIYGFGVYLLWRSHLPKWLKYTAMTGITILIPLIGISRVALNVHHASDILAGWSMGGLWLLGMILLYEYVENRSTQKNR